MSRWTSRAAALIAALLITGCDGAVPRGVFVTLNVSTRDIAVETAVNGSKEAFLSGESGGLVASAPLNRRLREGENDIEFQVQPAPDATAPLDPALLAVLEIAMKGETIDTLAPGERLIFKRELSEDEAARIRNGETLILTETFEINRERLRAMKRSGQE